MRRLNRKLGGFFRAGALAALCIGLVAPTWGARFAYVANVCSLCQSSVATFTIDPVSGALSGGTQTAAGQFEHDYRDAFSSRSCSVLFW